MRWSGPTPPPGMVRMLTVQKVAAYEEMLSTGRLLGGGQWVREEYERAYAWMAGRLMHGQNASAVWGWARVDLPGLTRSWPSEVAGNVVVLIVEVPASRTLISAFEPWQELLEHHGEPDESWSVCLEVERFPHSRLQVVTPYVDLEEIVAAYRLRP